MFNPNKYLEARNAATEKKAARRDTMDPEKRAKLEASEAWSSEFNQLLADHNYRITMQVSNKPNEGSRIVLKPYKSNGPYYPMVEGPVIGEWGEWPYQLVYRLGWINEARYNELCELFKGCKSITYYKLPADYVPEVNDDNNLY